MPFDFFMRENFSLFIDKTWKFSSFMGKKKSQFEYTMNSQ